MKKVIRLNENDLENLVKKILKEESVNPEWFENTSEPSKVYSFLFDLFTILTEENLVANIGNYILTYYVNQNNEVVMVKKTNNDGKNTLFLDSITVVDPLDGMEVSDDEIESSVKKMFREVFGEDIQQIQYSIPGSYLYAYNDPRLK